MKASKARTDQFGYTSPASAQMSGPGSGRSATFLSTFTAKRNSASKLIDQFQVLRSRYPSLPSDSVLYQSNPPTLSIQASGSSSSLSGGRFDPSAPSMAGRRGSPAGMMMNGQISKMDYKGKGRISNDGSYSNGGNDYLALDMGNGDSYGGNGDGSMQQMQLQQTQQVKCFTIYLLL